MNDAPATMVAPYAAPARPKAVPRAALARLAFGSVPSSVVAQSLGPRHLAFLPPEALELDLDDPQQRQFGDYELRSKLGQGGMGVVYRARQRSLDREVAIKLLSAGPWASSDFIERFRREAQSAARMQHPNIVAIYEIGAHDELNFFSMRLVQGISLAHELQESGPLPPKRAAQLLRTIAEALDYAHRLGVLHLDLKPANVLIDERGEPQVADFGLARRLDETLTRDNDEVSGTPSYMAPEQAQIHSHKLSQATDIYGLGAILYELLTGRPPFLAATPHETLKSVIFETPAALRQLRAGIPADLEAICLKCLAKEPGERYVSARALAEDLGRFVEGRPVSVRPLNTLQRAARWARREPRFAASVAVAALALIVGLVATTTQWRRADRNADDARQTLWSMRSQSAQASLVAGDGFRGLRPLVQNLAELEAAGRTDEALVERQRIGTVLANAPQLIDLFRFPSGTVVSSVAIAPDGKHFALATHGGRGKRHVRQYDLDGRELWSTATDELTHVLPFDGLPHGPIRYTKDGSRIVVLLAQMLVIPAPTVSDSIALDARDGRVLAPPGELGHADIVWNDDARLALLRFRSDRSQRFPDSGQLFDGETWQPLGPRLPHGTAAGADEWLWSPDGKRLLGSTDFEHFTLFEPATLAPQLQFDLPRGDPVRAWRFTPDGALLALGTLSGAVYLVDTRDGTRTSLPSAPTATVRWVEFSADGGTLAAQSEDNAIVSWDVSTRRVRAAPISLGNAGWGGRVLPVGDTLYSAIGDQLVSWSLAPYAPFDKVAAPGAARLRNTRTYMGDAFDVHDPGRLLIAAATDGTVGLWRLPRPALLAARAAPLPTRRLGFDGERIVAVDGTTVVLRDALTRAPRSRAFVHPENVRLAELSHDGKALVTVAGRTVRVLDVASGSLRGAPIVLPQTPLRADIASAAPVLALTTGEYVGDAYRERIHVIDLEHGRLRSSVAITIARYVYGFALDPRGRYVLITAWTQREGESVAVAAVDLDSGKSRCENMAGAPGEKQVGDVVIAPDGETAWTYAFQGERRVQFQRWRLADCVALATIEAPGTGSEVKLLPLGDGVVAHRMLADKLVLFDGAGGRRETPGGAREGSMFEFALSTDGHRAAVASRNAVQLVDLARGERASAPLPAPIPGNDAIAKLAFSPDGTRLLARTIQGRWLLWPVPEARQSTAELGEMAALLDRAGSEEPMSDEALAGLRQRLRAAAVEPPVQSATATLEPLALALADEARPSSRFATIDLGPALNVPLNGPWPRQAATGGDQPTLTLGAQRFLDVDYRVDGGVQLSRGGPATTIHPTEPESPMVAVPMLQARRVHVLTYMHIPVQRSAPSKQFARVVLIGVDGRETPLEIRTRRDVTSNYIPERADSSARIGFFGMPTTGVRGGGLTSSQTYSAAFAVALQVPPGTGTIRALRLEAGDGPMEVPLFYAVTFELDEADPAQPGMRAAR